MKHTVLIIDDDTAIREMMEETFSQEPYTVLMAGSADEALTILAQNPVDVVINLCHEAVPEPERFSRVLEIVPFANEERQASRVKYKTYRTLGITPQTHEINN